MQSPDVNVLVSAFREDAPHHRLCREWLEAGLRNEALIGVSELVLSGVLRILTHRRIFDPPTPLGAALEFVAELRTQPRVAVLTPGDGHWRIFVDLCRRAHATGNRIPDAYHAALAIQHGGEWVTLDRGFAAYPGLRFRNLLDAC